MIDIHCHLLPGLDDGAVDVSDSAAMARQALERGITDVCCTPHVNRQYQTTTDAVASGIGRLTDHLALLDVNLQVHSGGELDVSHLEAEPSVLREYSLAGRGRHVLIECPSHGWPLNLCARVDALATAGLCVIFAHPERSRDVAAEPARLEEAVEAGALVQVTSSALSRGPKPLVTRARYLVDSGLAHIVASDAHDTMRRPFGFGEARRAVRAEQVFRWMTDDAPAAVISGEDIPPRPAVATRRRWWSRRAGT